MKNLIKRLLALFIILCVLQINLSASEKFYAYHTKVQHSASDYLGKYADLIVVLGENRQLEFTRQTAYQPVWKTKSGKYLVDDFFPGRDKDYIFYYNYVRLLENTEEKIVVHWRYIPEIDPLNKSILEKDPLNSHGLLGVVHELFTIYPDGKVERVVKEAKGTTVEEWKNPNLAITQTLQLSDDGIDHSKVNWGRNSEEDDEEEEVSEEENGADFVNLNGLVNPVRYWRMDDEMEEISDEESMLEGINVLHKKGVSGNAMAFDGYYTGISTNNSPKLKDQFSLEAWIALDVYPYNDAPIIHQSKNFGEKGYYFGIDPYGKLLFRINGTEIKSEEKIALYLWQHVAVAVGEGKITLFQNGNEISSTDFNGNIKNIDAITKIGLNTEKGTCSDYVRTPQQNLPFIFGIQGVLDEVRIYDKKLSHSDVNASYKKFLPSDLASPIKKGILPGEMGIADKFGAYYKNLKYQELWDDLWRTIDDDVVVKFDNIPTSVIYWRGSNYAANWITDNNHWMSDQSSEIWGTHGCSEHMADKQIRHSYARIIENTPARVVIHWRYPCVDVGYICDNKLNWSDEYHTIYPDGTGIRKVHWNKVNDTPGFQDIQFFTNPNEKALDVVDLQAMDVANIKGDVEKLQWAKPNIVPKITIDDATIELLNSKSKYKIFVIFQGGNITPWGGVEQSAYTDDPFAGPWNHWPMHFVPSDGRFAVDHDRVTHFALAANDWAPQFGSLVHYGFTEQSIETVVPKARFWQNPPDIKDMKGGKYKGLSKDEKAFHFIANNKNLSFTINANKYNPVVNPAFVISNWKSDSEAVVKVNGKLLLSGSGFRQGNARDTNGEIMKIIWIELNTDSKTEIIITKN